MQYEEDNVEEAITFSLAFNPMDPTNVRPFGEIIFMTA